MNKFMSVCSHGVLQLYDGWQNQENVPLIDEHSTSRSTLNMGWTSLLIGLVCFRKIKSKAEIGKSNPKTETDLFVPILWDRVLQTGLGEEKRTAAIAQTHQLQSQSSNV